MRTGLLSLCCLLVTSIGWSQIVNIPDPSFKNICVNFLVVDTDGDGDLDDDVDTNDDGEIQVSEAEAVVYFFPRGAGIQSLEGIEAFVNIKALNCSQNSLTTMDLSQNVKLEELACFFNVLEDLDVSQLPLLRTLSCDFNELTTLDVSNNPSLERLDFPFNEISEIDLSQNTNLVSIDAQSNGIESVDFTQNPNLEVVSLEDNLLTSVDFSQNPLVRVVDLHDNLFTELDFSTNANLDKLFCFQNDLINLNIKNGNNMDISLLNATDNPNLNCVQVDDPVYAGNQVSWNVDDIVSYSVDCALGVTSLDASSIQIFPNPTTGIIGIDMEGTFAINSVTIHDPLGRRVYRSNRIESEIDVSNLKTGLFFMTLTSDKGSLTKQFIKQ
ncbi:MAG: T9SS type A sorting domain-containing protein [Flavobacteriaceae bacterium]|nr:T9SS type A sorting domain-containing protein [Flavobacteriaceae bacterium]